MTDQAAIESVTGGTAQPASGSAAGAGAWLEVVCGIVRRDGLFLASCRAAHQPHAGWWEFPGGKIEPGESAPEALARELREELGVEIGSPVFWRSVEHVYPDKKVRLHVFFVDSVEGDPCPAEGQAVRWVTPGEALTLRFLSADLALLRDLAEHHSKGGMLCIS